METPCAEENLIADWPIIFSVFIFCSASYAFLQHYGITRDFAQSILSNVGLYLAAWTFVVGCLILYSLARNRPESPSRFLLNYARSSRLVQRTVGFLGLLACLVVFMPIFSAFKSSIPIFSPFAWDSTLIEMDRTIFGGLDAWNILHPFFVFPIVTSVISFLYHFWYMIIYIGSIYIGVFINDRELRQKYFICYFLIWSLIGIFLANALSSVGPAFVSPLLGLNDFDQQMSYLRFANEQWPVGVLEIQEILLDWHRSGDHGYGRGISAMPSMHVALAVMFWLAMRRLSVPLGRIALLYSILIFVGSIHLAYHYAVDGILAAIIVIPLWHFSGWIAGLPKKQKLNWLGTPLRDLISRICRPTR